MAKKSLQELSIPELSKILDEFGQKQVVFQSEAQFQFNLAWRLQEIYDCNAKLEELTKVIYKNDYKSPKQKFYTDIVLEKDDYRVAIELKYKTASLEDGEVILFNHGATDLGRYDFIWDVKRLEMLLKPNTSEKGLKTCNKGFAIILTNDDDYWVKCWKPEDKSTDVDITIDNQFRIGEQNQQLHTGCLFAKTMDWKHNVDGSYPKTIQKSSSSRACNIVLNHAYTYEWKKYTNVENVKNGLFKYMIISVK